VKTLSSEIDVAVQEAFLWEIMENLSELRKKTRELELLVAEGEDCCVEDTLSQARNYRRRVFPKMEEVRACADRLETLVDKKRWPFPTYEDLLFRLTEAPRRAARPGEPRVFLTLPPHLWHKGSSSGAHSSVGQSDGLIIRWSQG